MSCDVATWIGTSNHAIKDPWSAAYNGYSNLRKTYGILRGIRKARVPHFGCVTFQILLPRDTPSNSLTIFKFDKNRCYIYRIDRSNT
jgi:hypothetical protein